MKEEFFSKKVKFKRVLKSLGIALLIVIPITGLLYYYIQFVFIHLNIDSTAIETRVLGIEDVSDLWIPDDYVLIPKTIGTLKYTASIGKRVFKKYDLGNGDILTIQCPQIYKKDFVDIPSIPHCRVSLNENIIFDKLRADVFCDDYSTETNCQQYIPISLYEDSSLEDKYLFVSDGTGSVYTLSVFDIKGGTYTELNWIYSEDKGGFMRGTTYYMAFTDSSKKEFRIITYNYDNTGEQESYYSVWKVEDNNLILESTVKDKKV